MKFKQLNVSKKFSRFWTNYLDIVFDVNCSCSAFSIANSFCLLYNIGIDSFVDTERGIDVQQTFFVRSDLEELGLLILLSYFALKTVVNLMQFNNNNNNKNNSGNKMI